MTQWLGEKTAFRFDELVDPNDDPNRRINAVIETVTSAWLVSPQMKQLCETMASARGSDANYELTGVLVGNYDITMRELARQGGEQLVSNILVDLPAELVEKRLRSFALEADNPHSAAAYVLDAALSPWGYFIGNVRFEDIRDPRHGVQVTYTLPTTVEELHACLEPWFKQLPPGEARDAFLEAVSAAKDLDGAACRAACERAAERLPRRDHATADTEPPKE
jgi:hypothetical protein